MQALNTETAREKKTEWERLERSIVSCRRCPRLREYCRATARIKRRAFRNETYWSRPVAGFGDRGARILLVGLAPAAHGANRTGRMFTGDGSGEWLFAALHRARLANQARSVSRDDGLRLGGAFVTAACRCAPPGNRPRPAELEACARFLDREFDLLDRLRVVVPLGRVAWDAVIRRARRVDAGSVPRPRPVFGHGAEALLILRPGKRAIPVVGCYHPSRQNTQTGRLTREMLDSVVARATVLARERRGSGRET